MLAKVARIQIAVKELRTTKRTSCTTRPTPTAKDRQDHRGLTRRSSPAGGSTSKTTPTLGPAFQTIVPKGNLTRIEARGGREEWIARLSRAGRTGLATAFSIWSFACDPIA